MSPDESSRARGIIGDGIAKSPIKGARRRRVARSPLSTPRKCSGLVGFFGRAAARQCRASHRCSDSERGGCIYEIGTRFASGPSTDESIMTSIPAQPGKRISGQLGCGVCALYSALRRCLRLVLFSSE